MFPLLFYRQDAESQGSADEMEKDEEVLRCGVCGARITSKKESIPMQGTVEHVFTNPFGYVFKLGCFRKAPGCGRAGEYTSEHSWFAGFIWCYALCASCRTHLGWHFLSEESSFFGLILENLA